MIKIYLTTLLTWVIITLIQSCNTDYKSSDQVLQDQTTSNLTTTVTEDSWPNNNKSKEFKIDSSDFTIYASKDQWRITLERTESFKNQINKIKETFNKISKEADLSELTYIGIQSINDELLFDIASIPEVQMELNHKSINGIVNSMGIVSPNAYKSRKLKEITDLFLKYNLEPYDYYIDKCRPEKMEGVTNNYSIHCASIFFKLRETNKE